MPRTEASGGPSDLQPINPRDVPIDRDDEEAINRLARMEQKVNKKGKRK